MKNNKKFWDRFAGLYTKIQQKSNAKMYEKITSDISEYFTEEMDVLELAMGTGQFTFSLYDKVKTYYATDFSERMLEEAKKIVPPTDIKSTQENTAKTAEEHTKSDTKSDFQQQPKSSNNVEAEIYNSKVETDNLKAESFDAKAKVNTPKSIIYKQEDATKLTFEDKSFDLVLIANALHIMPNPELAMKEINRVLKDGGTAIFPTFIYEGKIHRFRLFIMRLGGFKVFHEWNLKEYKSFIETNGFTEIKTTLYPSNIGPECVLIANKK